MNFLDANGTDASDPSLVEKVYSDGTRIVLTDSANITLNDELESQRTDAQSNVHSVLSGISLTATARDVAYALVGRSYAIANNETNAVIAAIVDRATATSYIQSTTRWASITSAQRQMWANDLEAEAVRVQATIALLRS